jgi:putative transposase
MGRIGRIVIPGFPHPMTRRGNRRQPMFFESGDQAVYRDLLAQRRRTASVEVWT